MKHYVNFVDEDKNHRTGESVLDTFLVSLSYAGMASMCNESEWRYGVYWKSTGIRVLKNTVFMQQDQAVHFAECLYRLYDPYQVIHPAMPENNFFQLVKWTVPNGLFLAAMFEAADHFALHYKHTLNGIEDMYRRYKRIADERVLYYTNRQKNFLVDNYGTKVEMA